MLPVAAYLRVNPTSSSQPEGIGERIAMKLLHDQGMSRTNNMNPHTEASRIRMDLNDVSYVLFNPLGLTGALDIPSRVEMPAH